MINYPNVTYTDDTTGVSSVLIDPIVDGTNPIIIIGRCNCLICGGKIAIYKLFKNKQGYLGSIGIVCTGCNSKGIVSW